MSSKMKDAHKLFKIPKSECPDIWIRLPKHQWPKSWSSMEDPAVPLERNPHGHPDLGEPTSCLDHVYLGCTQRECETSKDVVDNNRNMFESRVSARAKEKLPCSGKSDADIPSWSYGKEGHAKKCVERYCELATQDDSVAIQSRNSMP